MPSSPSSSAQEAREAVAARLRELLLDAGLTGRELAIRCGWHPSKSSRIMNGKTPPSDADIRSWCEACGAAGQADDIIAANRTADSMYVQWKKLQRHGMRRAQEEVVPLWERTRQFRVYASNVVPGMLQTPGYATALMASITEFQGTPDDVAEAVEARMARAHVIREGNHRFALLMEETVLRYRIGDSEAMAAQLGYLLAVMALPRVSLGIIPFTAPRRIWPLEAFYMFDDQHVAVELLTAGVNVKTPSEIAEYGRAFEGLAELAVHGSQARALITSAIESLG
ncbi:helix-turn-helix domain-containing protein [Streptomyces sp. NRRL WC-3742]|uniref:helix-turn-helix domain-containing protein n=1 Tax=Streptomyces sp. NRRL WC-3742 TaxID=1463934 RepID=UPI0004C50260|nr:helix-turn-helix transcriptional regulator [Streptomyces sp. NRRL WC-3742]